MAAGGKGFVFVFVVLAENCRITARAKGNNNVRLLRVIKFVVLSLLVLATDDASENGVLKRSGDRFWEGAEGGANRTAINTTPTLLVCVTDIFLFHR